MAVVRNGIQGVRVVSKVIIDDATLAKLGGLTKSAELYDERGNLLGYCLTVEAHLQSMDLAGPDPFSDEQAAAAVRDGATGITTDELLRRLREL